jgi:nickel/cobalt transporter (NicO) family protein
VNQLFDLQRWLQSSAVEALNTLQAGGLASAPWLMTVAFGFGLLHALLPGHGKLLLVSYHAGHGRPYDALLSSIIVIITHVSSAIIIVLAGFAVLRRTLGGAGEPDFDPDHRVLVALAGNPAS